MDPSPSKRINHANNIPDNPPLHDDLGVRPHKFQKTSTSVTGFSGSFINIPEFVGPIPTIHSQTITHHNQQATNTKHLHQQGKNQQESPRTQSTAQNNGNQQRNSPSNTEEEPFCWYQEDHIQEGVHSCQQSIIGKLLTYKVIPKQIINNVLLGIWGNPKGLQISEIEGGFLHITMDNDRDIQRALKGNPWTIRNSWLMVQPWDREKDPKDLDFHTVPIWLQLWNLPLHCKTITMGKHLGAQIGHVEDAAIYDFPEKARIIKIKVHMDTNQAIKPGIFIGNAKDGIKWIDFRYENLPMFCFLCGHIGHNESNCEQTPINTEEGEINPRGPWLRATSYGRRINDKRDPRFNSNPTKSMSGGCYSPIPKAMLDMLAKMNLDEEATTSRNNTTQDSMKGEQQNTVNQYSEQKGQQSRNQSQNSTNNKSQQTTVMAGLQSKASQGQ
jgi:hypothetical protein